MKQLFFQFTVLSVDLLAAAIFVAPFTLALWLAAARLRGASGRLYIGDLVRLLLFELYLCAIFSVVGLPMVKYIRFEPVFNLLPFLGMVENSRALLLTALNVLLFVPLGLFLPLLSGEAGRPYGWRQAAAQGFALSLTIELCQIFSWRLTDVDDLIANTCGTLAGYGLYCLLPEGLKRRLAARQKPLPLAVLVGLAAAVLMLFAPLFHQGVWRLIFGD